MAEESIVAPLNGVMGVISQTGKKLLIYMGDGEKNILNTGVNYQSLYKRTNSNSGLSGGAIAGIVIACVVALIALAVVAIMCRQKDDIKAPFDDSSLGIKTNSINQ